MHTWQEYLYNSSNDSIEKERLETYAKKLEDGGFPVIFDLYHLAYLLDINHLVLCKIINSAKHFYRKFEIEKKKGGKRSIVVPFPSLQSCQKWIKNNILERIPCHEKCYSYIKRKSIVDNATEHIGYDTLFKLDLKDFFDTITIDRVISIFIYCGYSHKVSYYLSRVCTLNDILPQGACSSPQISNIACKRLDKRLSGFCNTNNLIYSRYSDDLCFSGIEITTSTQSFIKQIIRSEGFVTNSQKQKLIIGKNKKKIVTGISITNGRLSVTREYKRNLKLEVFKYLKYGDGLEISTENFDPLRKEKLIGKLNFWKQIEPDNAQISILIKNVIKKELLYVNSL